MHSNYQNMDNQQGVLKMFNVQHCCVDVLIASLDHKTARSPLGRNLHPCSHSWQTAIAKPSEQIVSFALWMSSSPALITELPAAHSDATYSHAQQPINGRPQSAGISILVHVQLAVSVSLARAAHCTVSNLARHCDLL
jgi:hypothetical protein